MKLSLSLLVNELGDCLKQYHFNSNHHTHTFSRPLFYTEETILDYNTLYISHGSTLKPTLKFAKNSTLICISTPPQYIFDGRINLIIINETENIFSLSNKIHQIYDKFDEWELKLQKSINEWNPLQYILEISEPIFGNGLSIMDPDFNIIAESKLNSSAPGYHNDLDEFGGLPIEQVNNFKNDKKYLEIVKERNIFTYPNEILPYQCLCKNIFVDDENVFRIIISETTRPFQDYEPALLEYMSDYLEQAYGHIAKLHQEENSLLTSLFQNIMQGNTYKEANFNKELNKIGWSQDNTYRIVQILPSNHDIYITTMSYFCRKIMKEFKQTYAFINDNYILIIINTDKISQAIDTYFSDFIYFIREANFRVGFSNYMKGLNHLKELSLQAKIALEIGLLQNSTIWSHKFSDYAFPYILSKITDELPIEFIASPIVTRLQNYDLENSTEYLKTLQVYLKNNKNAVQTAKDLFIHRATIIYRIDRIKEIGRTDLTDSDELLHISLTLRLLHFSICES